MTNWIDLKMGISTVDCYCAANPDMKERRIARDNNNISPLIGFKISLLNFCDPDKGEQILKYHKQCGIHINTVPDAIFWLKRIFLTNITDALSYESDEEES